MKKHHYCEWMRRWSLIITIAGFIYFWFVTYPSAKSGLRFKDLSEGGTALWIFLIVGAIIILLQLIPAMVLFFSLIGTGAKEALKEEKTEEEITCCGCQNDVKESEKVQ